MSPTKILTTKCPHCEGPLVLQRAAPGDGQLRIVCSDCGAEAVTSPDSTMETIRIARPAGMTPVADTHRKITR